MGPESTSIGIETRQEGNALSLSLHLDIDPGAVRLRDTQMGTRVLLDGWPRAGKVGGPGLPARTLWIALPERTDAEGQVLLGTVEKHPLTRRETMIAPMRPPHRDVPDRARSPLVSVARSPELYRRESLQTAPNDGWTPSFVLDDGSYAKQLAVASNADERLEVVYIGSDDRLYHIWQTRPNDGWGPSTLLKG